MSTTAIRLLAIKVGNDESKGKRDNKHHKKRFSLITPRIMNAIKFERVTQKNVHDSGSAPRPKRPVVMVGSFKTQR